MQKKFLILCLLFSLALTGCGTKIEKKIGQEIKTIKIGTISPLSGDASSYGEQKIKTMEYYLDQVNKKAKSRNIQFEFIHEDGKCTGNDAVSAYQKLKDIDQVKFIIGGLCSNETLSTAPLTKLGDILTISAASSNSTINKASPYTYTFSYSDDVISKTLAKQMSKHKKLAIISEQDQYSIGVRDVWMKEVKKYKNVTIVANEIFPKGANDFRSLLEKVKQAKPDAIFLNPMAGMTTHNLVKQLGEIKDWKNYQLYGQKPYNGKEALAAAPDVTEGMIIVDSVKMTDKKFLDLKNKIEEAKGTVSDFGSYYVASTIDIMNILSDLILELGEDPKAVRDALATRTFNGYIGEIYFGDNNFPNIDGGVYIVKNGQAEYQE